MAVAKSLWAILEGSPVDPEHRVVASELRAKLEEIEAQAALNGALFFEDALADLPTGSEGDTAFVLDDGTTSNNGIYLKGASVWAKTANLPAAFTDAVSALADLATLESSLSAVATTGAYDDLSGKPTLGTAAAAATGDFATAGQGTKADAAARLLTRQAIRPELQEAFSNTLTGADRPAITIGSAAISAELGAVWRLDGTDAVGGYQDIAPRTEIAIEAGRVYKARGRLMRHADPADPLSHSIELRMQNLTQNRAHVSNVALESLGGIVVADGEVTFEVVFGLQSGLDYQCPASTRYALPYLRLYGGDHQTDIAVLEVFDATEAWQALQVANGAVVPNDLQDLVDKVDGIEEGATANSTDAALRDRSTHTGEQPKSSVMGLQDDLDAITAKTDQLTVTAPTDLDDLRTRVAELDSAVVLQGAWDASGGVFPGSGSSNPGWSWIVSVAGTVDGVLFQVNDRIIALVADASETVYADNWLKMSYSDVVQSVSGKTGNVVLVKSDVGLGAVDNTPDNAKAVSGPQQAVFDQQAEQTRRVAQESFLRTPQPQRADGIAPTAFDAEGRPTDWTNTQTGFRHIPDYKPEGWQPPALNGRVPVLPDRNGGSVLAYNLASGFFELQAPLVTGNQPPAMGGLAPTELREGRPSAGWRADEFVRLHSLHASQTLSLLADTHGVPQLFLISEHEDLGTDWARQVTYSQKGVTGWRWVKLPTADAPGIVQISTNDQTLYDRKAKLGRVEVYPYPPHEDEPTEAEAVFVLSQSPGVGAGSTSGLTSGAQTVNALMLRPREQFGARLLRFNGGVLPHQDGVEYEDRNTAINAAQLSSLVPLREGDNDNGEDRETYLSSLALHLNGPRGYDASKYLIVGSFGFGGSSFAELALNGGVVQTAYQNLLDAVQAAFDLCAAKGITLTRVHVIYHQGEADASTPEATFRDYMTGLHADALTRISAITGQTDLKLFLGQTIWTRGSFDEPCYSAYGQSLAADADEDIHLLPPYYFTDFDQDPIHPKAVAFQQIGALWGTCIADILSGRNDPTLKIAGATWSEAEISVAFNHPITLDFKNVVPVSTTEVTAGRFGVHHGNSNGSTRGATGAHLVGANTLVLELVSAVPAGAVETVYVAASGATNLSGTGNSGNEFGLRSNIRRADDYHYSMITGVHLPIYARIEKFSASEV